MLEDWGAGVPVAGVSDGESDAFSALPLVTASMADAEGDCLAGVSSLTNSGSTMARSFGGGALRVTMRVGLLEAAAPGVAAAAAGLPDFRRSLAAAALLLEGAIAKVLAKKRRCGRQWVWRWCGGLG